MTPKLERYRHEEGRTFLNSNVLLAASSAVAHDVHYNFAAEVDFSKCKTYKWIEIKNVKEADQLVYKQIRDALDAQLAEKHLTKTDGRPNESHLQVVTVPPPLTAGLY
jgi:hypothetical protein